MVHEIFQMGSLSESLHLILVIKSFNEKRRCILGCPLVLFGILAEWKDDGIYRHLHHSKEKSGHDVTKTPAHLRTHKLRYISINKDYKNTF